MTPKQIVFVQENIFVCRYNCVVEIDFYNQSEHRRMYYGEHRTHIQSR